jgi:hypothetical protein
MIRYYLQSFVVILIVKMVRWLIVLLQSIRVLKKCRDFVTNCREPMPNNIIFLGKGSLLSPMRKLTKTFPKYIYTWCLSFDTVK